MRRIEPTTGARGHPRRPTALVATLLLTCALASTSSATARGFSLGSWTGFAEVGFDFQDQDQSIRDETRPLLERTVSEQRMGFRNTATIVGPRFLTVNFGLSLGFLQSDLVSGDRQAASGDGQLRGFDLSATFLPLRSYGFNLFASRVENITPVEFVGRRRLENTTYGLAMQVGPSFFPARLSFRDVELEATSELELPVRGLDQRARTISYRGENRWRRHEAYAFLQYQDIEDRVTRRFSNETGTIALNHTVELLPPRLATLRSSVRYFERSGELLSSSFDVDEELSLRHRDNLRSGLRYEARRRDSFSGFSSEDTRWSGWLQHSLWESLETHLRVGKASLSSDAGNSGRDEARLHLVYRKKLPRRGRLEARLLSSYERLDSLQGSGERLVTGERLLVRFGVPTRLDMPAVIRGTVVVTDELESTIYEEGADYEIQYIGDFAEILPLAGGRLTDGQAVLVQYRVRSPALNEYSSRRTDLTVSVDYGWIEPFFGYQSTDTDLRQGPPSSLLDDRRERFAGTRFRVNRTRLQLQSFNEVRSRDSGLLAFDSLRLANGISYSPRPRWVLNANVVHVETDFETPVRRVRIDDRRLSARWQPMPALGLESYASLRQLSDSLAPDQTFARLGLNARWSLGKVSVIGAAERWQRQRGGEELDGVTASLKISRRFFPGRVTAKRWAPTLEPWPEDLPGLVPDPDGEAATWEQHEPLDSATPDLGALR